jgi:hypothetical protein
LRYRLFIGKRLVKNIVTGESKNQKKNLLSAKQLGFIGNQLVMANEGYQICDNESLADLNVPLMILHDSQNWESSLDITEVVVPVPNIREVQALEDNLEIEEIEIHETVEPVIDSTEDDLVTNDVQEQFDAFTIPWLKVPADITEFFQKNQVLPRQKMQAFSNLMISELRQIHPKISAATIRRVASSAAQTFPSAFLQKDEEGVLLDPNPISLFTKMVSRRNFLNRRPNEKVHTSQQIMKPLKKAKKK